MEATMIMVCLILFVVTVFYDYDRKSLKLIQATDLKKNKEVLLTFKIKTSENMEEEIDTLQKKYTKIFKLTSVAFSVAFLLTLFYLIACSTIPNHYILIVLLAALLILTVVVRHSAYLELSKMIDPAYPKKLEQEKKRLQPIRIFFIISSLTLILAFCLIDSCYNWETTNTGMFNIGLSVIMIYLGGMGLVAKLMLLRLPLQPDGSMQPFINSVVLIAGIVNLLNVWLHFY